MTVDRVNPSSLSPPVGFSHAVVGHGAVVFLAGQTAQDATGHIVGSTLLEQFERALQNLVVAVTAAGSSPDLLAKLVIYCTDADAYTRDLAAVGEIWRRVVGRTFPAMTFVEVTRLFDPTALVEVDAYAIVE